MPRSQPCGSAARRRGRREPGRGRRRGRQQSLRDAETAYRNFFASLKGSRKGPRAGPPRFKSRKDARQSMRFTANARWNITDSGRLNLPKIGAVKVKGSRTLPTTPTSVTVIKDAAGRIFASFVIDTDPAATRMPETDHTIGIDLGLTHFAVLCHTKVGVGVRVRLPFKVTQLSDRLVVDVAHSW